MRGSARASLGRAAADAAREEVLHEVATHTGDLIVIDGFLSDELSDQEAEIIETSLIENEAEGHLALRVWGCDAGEDPYLYWRGFGLEGRHATFDGQEEAAKAVSEMIQDGDVVITGAWVRDDLSSGCATSVMLALKEVLGERCDVTMSDCALREPDEELDDELEV
jgi:hypothetical protein